MSGFGLASTSLEMSRTEATVLEMPASVDFERNGFPSRHCDVIPESEEMDTDSSDCEHEVEVEDEEDESAMKEEQLLGELRQEVLSCYSQLRNMGSLLRARERGRAIDGESLDTSSSSGSSSVTSQALRVRDDLKIDIGSNLLQAGQLVAAVGEVASLLVWLQRQSGGKDLLESKVKN